MGFSARACATFLLLGAGRAEAWTWDAAPRTDLPAPVLGVEVVPHQQGEAILALGGQVSWLVDPSTGAEFATLPVGARDAALADLTGDARRDLVLCGPQGLQVVPWEGLWRGTLRRLDTRPCDAVTTLLTGDETLLAVVGADLRLYAITGPWTIEQRALIPIPVGDRVLLASEADRVAVSAVGATEIVEWSPSGTSTLATGGPIGGLALGPWGWSWSLPDKGVVADMTHRTVPVDAGPGAMGSGDLDQDGQRDLVVVHRDARIATFLLGSGANWSRGDVSDVVSSIATGDLDADGCDDVVLGSSSPPGVRVLHTTDCARDLAIPVTVPVVPPMETGDVVLPGPAAPDMPDLQGGWQPPAPIERPPHVLGVALPWFLGDRSVRDVERLGGQQYVVVGSGWAMGGALKNVYLQIPFFPALAVELEWGGPRVRWFVGGDSAALFLWMADEGSGIHLVNGSTGVTFGSPRLRTGPFVTGGLVNFGAGWRTVFTPWDDGDTFKGVEVRTTWMYPYTGEVMVLYVWSQPMREPRRKPPVPAPPPPEALPLPVASAPEAVANAAVTDDQEPTGERPPVAVAGRPPKGRDAPAFFACRRFGFSVGAAGGVSSTRYSWEYVGSDVPVTPSVSPALAAQCETGKGAGMVIGFETAPFYSYLTRDDDKLHQMGSHTFGFWFGGDGFRIGPTVTAGIWTLGGGLRTAIKIRRDRQGVIHQLDVRASVHWPSALAGQLMLLYGVSFDPWR